MPLNVRLQDANFSKGPDAGFFYSCDFSNQRLIRVQGDGTFAGGFPVSRSTFRNPITELHFDGTFFWTLEDLPSDLGIVVKRWRLFPFPTAVFPAVVPFEFRWFDELTLINGPNMRWSSNAFAIESRKMPAPAPTLNSSSKVLIMYLAERGSADVSNSLIREIL